MNYKKNALLNLAFALLCVVNSQKLHASKPLGSTAASAAGLSSSPAKITSASAAADRKRTAEPLPLTLRTNSNVTVEDDPEFVTADHRTRNRLGSHSSQIVIAASGQSAPKSPNQIRRETVAQAVGSVEANDAARIVARELHAKKSPDELAEERRKDEALAQHEIERQLAVADLQRKAIKKREAQWEAEDAEEEDVNAQKRLDRTKRELEEQKKLNEQKKAILSKPVGTLIKDGILVGVNNGIVGGIEDIVKGAITTPIAYYGGMAFEKLNRDFLFKEYYDRQNAAMAREHTLIDQRKNVWQDSRSLEHQANAAAVLVKGPLQAQISAIEQEADMINKLLAIIRNIMSALDTRGNANFEPSQNQKLDDLLEEFEIQKEKVATSCMPSFMNKMKEIVEMQTKIESELKNDNRMNDGQKAKLSEKLQSYAQQCKEREEAFTMFSELENPVKIKQILADKQARLQIIAFLKFNRMLKNAEREQVKQQSAALSASLMEMMSHNNAKQASLNQIDMQRLDEATGSQSHDGA